MSEKSVVDLNAERKNRAKPKSYHVRIDQFPDNYIEGAILGLGDEIVPFDLMRVANQLSRMAQYIRLQAFEASHDSDHRLICNLEVYGSGRVWTRSEPMTSAEQIEWLRKRLDEAHAAIIEMSNEGGADD